MLNATGACNHNLSIGLVAALKRMKIVFKLSKKSTWPALYESVIEVSFNRLLSLTIRAVFDRH
jgi:hypothetical protein